MTKHSSFTVATDVAWTLFDLRPLRRQFSSLGRVDRELERLIFGYDVLIVIPEVSAQKAIQ